MFLSELYHVDIVVLHALPVLIAKLVHFRCTVYVLAPLIEPSDAVVQLTLDVVDHTLEVLRVLLVPSREFVEYWTECVRWPLAKPCDGMFDPTVFQFADRPNGFAIAAD